MLEGCSTDVLRSSLFIPPAAAFKLEIALFLSRQIHPSSQYGRTMSHQWPQNRIAGQSQSYRNLSKLPAACSHISKSHDSSSDLAADENGRFGLGTPRPKLQTPNTSQKVNMLTPSGPSTLLTSVRRPVLLSRGQPQLHISMSDITSQKTLTTVDSLHNEPSTNVISMPMPVRPKKSRPSVHKNFPQFPAHPVKKDPRPKPYMPRVPPLAPHFSPIGNTDFFPWAGNHPEDQFSEHVIRQGYYDKTQMTQNEIGSARSFIFPALKHKSGLQTLSSVFTNILVQRRAHGQIISSSTFKPPPRVTVTDTKREIWLKDLANPISSLRRLSRSIPHGIRGKVLLEQSLLKNIPIERAVWLAKCVGANELRSFRRKGVSGTFAMGGEAKWIRDFTICVEQFLENIIGVCGETDFKAKFDYAIRLATHFHGEYLLDHEHYMDWLVTSLESTSQMQLPIWLLIIQIYWEDLSKCRKYGRKLSSILLNQLAETLDDPDSDLLTALSERLTSLLKELMLTNHNNFVSPKIWSKYRNLITSHFKSDDEPLKLIIRFIDVRNSRLILSDISKKDHPEQKLIQILDQCLITPYSSSIAKEGWSLSENKKLLVRKVFEWSTSLYRPGKTKVYVATRVLRAWSKNDISITESVLNFLDSKYCETGRNKSDLYHVISELTRSGHFSVPTYIQWLISRGGVQSLQALERDGPCASRLLAELPTINLSESTRGSRLTLLKRANFPVEEEQECIKLCLSFFQTDLSGKPDRSSRHLKQRDLACKTTELLFSASRTIKSEIGLQLREKVCLQMIQQASSSLNDIDKSTIKKNTPTITSSNFNAVRNILEDIGDFSMLADILKVVSKYCGVDILATCADTLNLHLETFAAIGALSELFGILLSRLRALRDESGNVLGNFLTSLLDLSLRLEDQKIIAQELAQEVSLNFKKAGIDAFSPISDQMTSTDTTEAIITEEFEKLLNSRAKLDHTALEQLFERIISVLESSWERLPEQQRSCGMLLTRLRAFNQQNFDLLMMNWLNKFIMLPNRPNLLQFCAPLISSGCLALHDVLESCGSKLQFRDTLNSDRVPSEALLLLLSSMESLSILTSEEIYRFRIKQLNTQRKYPENVLITIRKAFELLPYNENFRSQSVLNLESLSKSQDLQQVLQNLILFDSDLFLSKLLMPILKSSNTDAISVFNKVIDLLLRSTSPLAFITIEILLDIADDLSLPYCKAKIKAMFRPEEENCNFSELKSNQIEELYSAVKSAISSGNSNWVNLISLLDDEIAQELMEKAETNFIALVPSPKSVDGDDLDTLKMRILLGKNLLRVIQATSHCISSISPQRNVNNSKLISEIAIALNDLWTLLASCYTEELKNLIIESWIPLLFSFTKIHAIIFEENKSRPESRAKTILALTAIYFQLQALDKDSELVKDLIEQSYDLALYFIDSLPDDTRQQCIRSLNDAVSNPYISYLYSHVVSPSDHFFLSQKERYSTSSPGEIFDNASSTIEEKLVPFSLRRWEMLSEPTPNVGENDTSLSLTLFGARKG